MTDDDFTITQSDIDALMQPPTDLDRDGIPDHLDPLDDRVLDELFAPIETAPIETAPDGSLSLAPGYYGDHPADAAEHWHMQEQTHSCAVAVQEFILDDITGIDHPEGELTALAEAKGWYTPGQGTPYEDIGKVLEAHGIPTEQQFGATADGLAAALASGEHVIVGVDSSEIMAPGYDPADPMDAYPGIPGQGADHAVQVIGIDNSDPTNPMVIVNDSGVPDGRAGALPLGVFLEAWDDSGNFMMTASAARAGAA